MKKLTITAAMLLLSLACFADPPEPKELKDLEVGSKVPGFSLVNSIDGKTVAFKPGDGKLSVVVFTCNSCPFAKAFEPRIIELANQYAAKGVQFYAINPNDDEEYSAETMEKMKSRAVDRKYPYAYLKDGDSSVARAYGARVTPHVYVVDGTGTLRYRGYVDDNAKPAERTKTGLSDALNALLANQTVSTTVTREFGCSIKWKA